MSIAHSTFSKKNRLELAKQSKQPSFIQLAGGSLISFFIFLTCCRDICSGATMQGLAKKAKKGSQSSSSPRARSTNVESINFANIIDLVQVSWPQRWAHMYEYIKTTTKTTKLPPQAVRDSDDSELDEEVYNEELLRLQRFRLHLIAARPIILQMTDVLQWIATHVDFRWMVIVSDEGKIVGLLTLSNFHSIYHLKPVEVKCNKDYLDNFYMTNPKPHEVMKNWYKEEEDFKDRVGVTKYSPKTFISLAQYLTSMLSRLHRGDDCTNFKSEWLPIAHGVMSAIVFNWASILSQNLLKPLEKVVRKPDPKGTIFYFTTYLLDALCASNSFPGLNWAWTPKSPPIHLHYRELWRENDYK